jgi:membrane protein implicated in regulation of membrane protease activity
MKGLKTALLVLGFLFVLVGLLWIGQGTGYVPWPASSFMIDQTPWAYRGVALAVAGLILMVFSRRSRGRRKP